MILIDEVKRFVLMVQFMTRIPVPVNIHAGEGDFGKGSRYFPVIGLILGLLVYAVYYGSLRELPEEISVLIAIAASYALTGCMHIDGLADTFDGLFSARSRDKVLDIMKDSRIGTNGVLAVLFVVLFKALFLMEMDPLFVPTALIIAHVMGRWAMVPAMAFSRSARDGKGLGGLFIGRVKALDVAVAAAFTLVFGYFFSGFSYAHVIWIAVISALSGLSITGYIHWRIGGMTGDTVGSIGEITELISYAYVFMATR